MFFFLRKKEVVLDCFTHSTVAYEHAKIDYAKNHYPEWWMNESKITSEDWPTIKYCTAFKDFHKKGIVISSWFEMKLIVCSDGTWEWASSNDNTDTSNSHPNRQFSGFALNNGINIKLTSCWHFQTKDDINFIWSQPTWHWRNLLNGMTLLPGVLNFKYQHITNINLFVEIPKHELQVDYRILPLMPLAIIHPMTEKHVRIKNHLIDKEEFLKKKSFSQLLLLDDFKSKLLKSRKYRAYVDSKDKKCPFHQ